MLRATFPQMAFTPTGVFIGTMATITFGLAFTAGAALWLSLESRTRLKALWYAFYSTVSSVADKKNGGSLEASCESPSWIIGCSSTLYFETYLFRAARTAREIYIRYLLHGLARGIYTLGAFHLSFICSLEASAGHSSPFDPLHF